MDLINAVVDRDLSKVKSLIELGVEDNGQILILAAAIGDKPIVEFLIEKRKMHENDESILRFCLFEATRNNRLTMVQYLLDTVEYTSISLDRAYAIALRYKYNDIAKYLMSKGAIYDSYWDF